MQYFSNETVKYFNSLKKNNNRNWFEKHRSEYNSLVLEPAQQFIVDMGLMIREIIPEINAIPKIDKSIFRIYRDVRFSKNKDPYKTNIGLYFWEGSLKKMECPGFYFHLDSKGFYIGAGVYQFTKKILDQYRKSVSKDIPAKELISIIKHIGKLKDFTFVEPQYKKIPRGFENNQYSDLVLYKSLYAGYQGKDLDKFLNSNQLNFVFKKFNTLLPLHNWFMENVY